jgi:hypothetical protein
VLETRDTFPDRDQPVPIAGEPRAAADGPSPGTTTVHADVRGRSCAAARIIPWILPPVEQPVDG